MGWISIDLLVPQEQYNPETVHRTTFSLFEKGRRRKIMQNAVTVSIKKLSFFHQLPTSKNTRCSVEDGKA